MKILTNKRYNDLLDKISLQVVEIEELEESNKLARSKYYEQIHQCEIKGNEVQRLSKELEDARYYNQWLQERLNDSEKKVLELQKTKIELESTIEYIKSGL